MSNILHERARIAALSRSRQADDPELVAARRNLKVLRLEEHIESVLGKAPALTDEQRSKLAELLRPVRGNGAA